MVVFLIWEKSLKKVELYNKKLFKKLENRIKKCYTIFRDTKYKKQKKKINKDSKKISV